MNTLQKNLSALLIASSGLCLSLFIALPSLAADTSTWPPKFSEIDKNGDQVIDPREFIGYQNQKVKKSQPGSISRLNFLDFDRNNDSLISKDEFDAGLPAASLQAKPGKGVPKQSMGNKMPMQSMPGFEDFDLDGDGKLLKDEFYQARNQRMTSRAEQGFPMRRASEAPTFEQIDRNGDGIVDKDEFLLHQKDHWRGGPRTQ